MFRCRYHEIIPNERIVYDYDMYVNELFPSVSLAMIEMAEDGKKTRMKFTEQAVFLDGVVAGLASREQGSAGLLDNIGKVLAGEL